MGTIFRVRIPPWARRAFHGVSRLNRRFSNEAAGEAWVKQTQLQIAKLKAGAEASSVGIEPARSIDFRTAVGGWLAQADIRDRTREWYRIHLNAHLMDRFGSVPLSQISRSMILDHLEARKRKRASAINRSRDVVILKAVLNWSRKRGYQVDLTAFEVKKPRTTPTVTRRFDPEATERFLSSVEGRDRVILEVAAFTGMRAGELRAFDCSWIQWHESRILIPHDTKFSPKGRKPRSLPLFKRLRKRLLEWLGDRRDGLVFPPLRTRSRHGLNGGAALRLAFQRAKKASGVDFQGLHDLRHFYISFLAYKGMKPTEIKDISGHETLAVVNGYMHAAPDSLSRARQLLDEGMDELFKDGEEVGTEVGTGGRRGENEVSRKPALEAV